MQGKYDRKRTHFPYDGKYKWHTFAVILIFVASVDPFSKNKSRIITLKMSKILQATNRTWLDSTATSVFENCPVIHCFTNDNGSTEATKIKITAKVCHLYFWSNNSALFEHWNWKSSFKHRWIGCFRSNDRVFSMRTFLIDSVAHRWFCIFYNFINVLYQSTKLSNPENNRIN
jgi:hypothetical protein